MSDTSFDSQFALALLAGDGDDGLDLDSLSEQWDLEDENISCHEFAFERHVRIFRNWKCVLYT